MDSRTIEELQKELSDKIAKLDVERAQASERHYKEQSERRIIEEVDRAKQIAKIKADEAKFAKRKADQEAEEIRRNKEKVEERMAMEAKQNAADEQIRLYREKLEWLEGEIEKAQFVEEQHRKSLENTMAPLPAVEGLSINVENPVAPLNVANPGEAVEGTDGRTPDSPQMSNHLKMILRQATRQ